MAMVFTPPGARSHNSVRLCPPWMIGPAASGEKAAKPAPGATDSLSCRWSITTRTPPELVSGRMSSAAPIKWSVGESWTPSAFLSLFKSNHPAVARFRP